VNTLCRMALLLVGTLGACVAMAPPNRHVTDAHAFDKVAQEALSDMREKAYALGIGGVAVVAYFEGDPMTPGCLGCSSSGGIRTARPRKSQGLIS